MSEQGKSSGVPPIVFYIVGLLLMIGGSWLAVNWHPAFMERLEAQGIPLNLGATIAVVGVFLILFQVIKFFFITPLSEAIGARTTELERTFSEAEDLRAEMTKMRTEYEQRLVQTEAQAREQIQAQIREAQNLRQELMAEASARADEMVKKAQQEIAHERDRVMADLRQHVVNLTLGATERILSANVDNDANRRLVNEFIDRVEVPS